ncbi:uncharacterized protein N7529_012089 [Penicillium soppii]|uniref:uncharacterized protein n=1 Tax=Penicillium soppii TaxID=69789 RepID=UPI0025486605|nr:uncharacterized protein N7529_012089 [Penicillium soppii]KAJ5852704.1 hypothetical protein N7529_012089 [Penicillium soppii]
MAFVFAASAAAASMDKLSSKKLAGRQKDCTNRDDARKAAHDAGCQNVRNDNHQGTLCNAFGCNCDWGCSIETGYDDGNDPNGRVFVKEKCPASYNSEDHDLGQKVDKWQYSAVSALDSSDSASVPSVMGKQ